MFVGHLAVAFASKRLRPQVSLGWYVGAATTLDVIWPVFLLLDVEHVRVVPGATAFNSLVFDSYPWSHSLLMAIVWGAVLAIIARWRGVAASAATLIAFLVVSHWILDFVTHAPDMPLWPGNSPRFGLGLWNSNAGTLAVEGALWIGGIILYLSARHHVRWTGPLALWSLVALTTVMWAAGPWSPPPPNPRALAWFALVGGAIMIPWSVLSDKYYSAWASVKQGVEVF